MMFCERMKLSTETQSRISNEEKRSLVCLLFTGAKKGPRRGQIPGKPESYSSPFDNGAQDEHRIRVLAGA